MDDNLTPSEGATPEPPAPTPAPAPAPTPQPTPQPAASPQLSLPADEKSQSTLMWVLTIFFGFIPGLIFFLMATGKPYLKRNAAQALFMTGGLFAVYIVLDVLAVVAHLGFLICLIMPFMGLAGLFSLIMCIMGAIACNKGEEFTLPLIGTMAINMLKA